MSAGAFDRVVQYQQKVDVVSTSAETVSVDRWHFLPILPRRKPQTRDTNATVGLDIPSETITVDKWFSPASTPVIRRRRLPEYQPLFIDPKVLTLAEAVTLDRWEFFPQIPVRRRGEHAARQEFSPFLDLEDVPEPTPPADTTTAGKIYPLRYQVIQPREEVERHERPEQPEQLRKRRKLAPVAPPDTSMADQLALVQARLEAQQTIQTELNAAQARALAEENALLDEDGLMIALALALWP